MKATGSKPVVLIAFAILVTSTASLVASLYIAGGTWQPPEGGLPDSGVLIGWLNPIATLFSFLIGLRVIAGWLSGALFSRPEKSGALTPETKSNIRKLTWWSLAWSGTAFATAAVIIVEVLALPARALFDLQIITAYGWDIPQARAMLVMSLIALFAAIAAATARTLTTAGVWAVLCVIALTTPPLFSHGASVSGHSTAVGGGFLHGASMALWLGGLAALISVIARSPVSAQADDKIITHFSLLATLSVVALALSGVMMAWTRLTSPVELFTTGYGLIVLLKALVLIGAASLAVVARRRTRLSQRVRLFGIEISLATVAIGAGVALSLSPFPREAVLPATLLEQLTGYPEPAPFTLARAFASISIDPTTLLVGLVALGLYWLGVWRLARRGDKWPLNRTIFWSAGVILGLYVTNSMLGRYALVMFSVHMGVHMVLSMFVPILLVLGGPVTLALRAIRPSVSGFRGPREWLIALLQAPVSKFIANPFVAFILWVSSAFALYLTSLFTTVMTDPLGHILMNAHFLVAGYLFFWNIIGVDPPPSPLPPFGRLGLLIAAIAIHGFFGVIVMGSNSPLGGTWFTDVTPTWLTSSVSDQQVAGGIAWAISEIPMLFVLIVLGLQWARSDSRKAKQDERSGRSDQQLNDYNAMLSNLGAPTSKS